MTPTTASGHDAELRAGRAKGIVKGELSWVLETNDLMVNGIQRLGGTLSKRYRLYEKGL